ncbi:unnamed protein product [Boreogadus saida]
MDVPPSTHARRTCQEVRGELASLIPQLDVAVVMAPAPPPPPPDSLTPPVSTSGTRPQDKEDLQIPQMYSPSRVGSELAAGVERHRRSQRMQIGAPEGNVAHGGSGASLKTIRLTQRIKAESQVRGGSKRGEINSLLLVRTTARRYSHTACVVVKYRLTA